VDIELSADDLLFGPDLPFEDIDLLGAVLASYGYFEEGYDCEDMAEGPAEYATPTLDAPAPAVLAFSDEGRLTSTPAEVTLSRGLLDRSPKKNWVEESGGLPKYIEDIAHDLHTERGMSISRAIATAISKVKKWAAGGDDVKPDTRAKAAKAVAEWEALRAKNAARRAKRG
jgi:hypothetical protein